MIPAQDTNPAAFCTVPFPLNPKVAIFDLITGTPVGVCVIAL